MILISHRGNIDGENRKLENHPDYLYRAFKLGYQVEADIWYDGGWWTGHDHPQYKIDFDYLHNYWCHAKNKDALEELIKNNNNIHYFWHDKDDYTITSKGYCLIHSQSIIIEGGIYMLPEKGFSGDLSLCKGICSDKIANYKMI